MNKNEFHCAWTSSGSCTVPSKKIIDLFKQEWELMAETQEETAIFHSKWDEIIWCPQCVENILEVLLRFSHSYKFWKFLTFKVEAIKSILVDVVVSVKEPSNGNHKVSCH